MDVTCAIANRSRCSTTVEYVGYLGIFTSVSLVGVVLNILNLLVLTRTQVKMNQSTHMFLTALAAADLLGLLFSSPIGIVRCAEMNFEWEHFARSYYEAYIFLPFANSFASCSVYLTVVVSVERFICVKYSAINKQLNRRRISQLTIACCVLAALAMNMPYMFYQRVDPDNASFIRTSFGDSANFPRYLWIRLALNKIIPIIIVAVFNALLVNTVITSTRHAKTLVFPNSAQARRQRQQTRLTIMMMSISIMFIVCHILEPLSHGEAYRAIFGPCSTLHLTYTTLTMVTNTLETLSYGTNFIFYCIFHRQFLKGLQTILCCCYVNKVLPKTGSSAVIDGSVHAESRHPGSSKLRDSAYTRANDTDISERQTEC